MLTIAGSNDTGFSPWRVRPHLVRPQYTAVSTKVVPQKRTRQCRLVLWVEKVWH